MGRIKRAYGASVKAVLTPSIPNKSLWSLLLVDLETIQARSPGMEDLSAKLEKLLAEAEDCDLIGGLAIDLHKRELFEKLALDLRGMARDIEASLPNAGAISASIRLD